MNDPWGVKERIFDEKGTLIINRSQDVEGIINKNKCEASELPSMSGDAKFRKVGSIPFVIAEKWSSECGEAIGTKGFAEYAKKKLMDGDFSAFRVKGY